MVDGTGVSSVRPGGDARLSISGSFTPRQREMHKAMKTTQRLLVVIAAALLLLAGTGCNKLKARDHLNKGVQAYKNSKF